MALFNFIWRQKTPQEKLMETPLPPELAYAYGKITDFPGGEPQTDIGPPYALDKPSWGPPPATIGDLMARLGPLKAIEELMPKPAAQPEWKVAGSHAVRLPPPGSTAQPEFAMPPPARSTQVHTDVLGQPHTISYGAGEPPTSDLVPGSFPVKPPEQLPETFEPPYAGPGGSLLQRSSRGKISSVLGRTPEGMSQEDSMEFKKVKESQDFVLKFVSTIDPMKAMLLSLKPDLMANPAFMGQISGQVPTHLKRLYDQHVRTLEKYYNVPGKSFTYDPAKGDFTED